MEKLVKRMDPIDRFLNNLEKEGSSSTVSDNMRRQVEMTAGFKDEDLESSVSLTIRIKGEVS